MSPNASKRDGAVVRRSLARKLPRAVQDLSDIAVYLASESGSVDLAFRFLDAAEASFEDLSTMPEMGAATEYRHPSLEGVRMWRIAGFDNYLVFYRVAEGVVEIIRVLHAKRDIVALFDSSLG
jgi:toxin ParE1/3/4